MKFQISNCHRQNFLPHKNCVLSSSYICKFHVQRNVIINHVFIKTLQLQKTKGMFWGMGFNIRSTAGYDTVP